MLHFPTPPMNSHGNTLEGGDPRGVEIVTYFCEVPKKYMLHFWVPPYHHPIALHSPTITYINLSTSFYICARASQILGSLGLIGRKCNMAMGGPKRCKNTVIPCPSPCIIHFTYAYAHHRASQIVGINRSKM